MKKTRNVRIWVLAGLLLVIACGSAAYNLGFFEPLAAKSQEPTAIKSQEPSINASENTQGASENSRVAVVQVYVDEKLAFTAPSDRFKDIRVNIGEAGIGTHEVRIWTFDRFLNRTEKVISIENDVDSAAAVEQKAEYTAFKAQTAPAVDGQGSDECWKTAGWADIDSLWLGNKPLDQQRQCIYLGSGA